MYGARTAPENITYSVNPAPTVMTVNASSTNVTGKIFVRLASAFVPIKSNRANMPRPRQNKKEYISLI